MTKTELLARYHQLQKEADEALAVLHDFEDENKPLFDTYQLLKDKPRSLWREAEGLFAKIKSHWCETCRMLVYEDDVATISFTGDELLSFSQLSFADGEDRICKSCKESVKDEA